MRKLILTAAIAISSAAGVSYNQVGHTQTVIAQQKSAVVAEASALKHPTSLFTGKADIGQADVSAN